MLDKLKPLPSTHAAADKAVLEELEIFGREAGDCVSFLYALTTIHAVASKSPAVKQKIDRDVYFWLATMRALQSSLVIALGRVFRQDSVHSVDVLMKLVRENRIVFAREGHRFRKWNRYPTPEVLVDHLRAVVPVTEGDVTRLARMLKAHRKRYLEKYDPLRSRYYAHRDLTESEELDALFAKTKWRELERMVTFLNSLHYALFDAYHNGTRVSIRSARYAVGRMLAKPKGERVSRGVHERVVEDTARALRSLSEAPPVKRSGPTVVTLKTRSH